MEARLKREMEKNRSVLANASAPLPGYTPVPDVATRGSGTWEKSTGVSGLAPDEHGSYAPDTGLTEEQVQMFEKGNQDMMTHYQMTLDKVRYRHELEPSHRSQLGLTKLCRTAEKSLVEIAELQTTLANNLTVQASHIDQLVADSENVVHDVGSGNKELKRATERPSAARYTFFAASGLCVFLVLWDLVI